MVPEMKWWGWGDPAHRPSLPESAAATLRDELGVSGEVVRRPVALEDVRLGEPRLPEGVRDRLVATVGGECVRDDRAARVAHAAGKSYPDLVRQRSGDATRAPDAVVYPDSHERVRAVLDVCAAAGVAVVPFGGGTSVVGGVEPERGPFGAVIALDLARLDRLVDVDERSLLAVVQGGLRAPAAEGMLARRGLTLGHFPQSFEYVSLGGCVATRSAGQASTGYGRIDELVASLRMAAPAGDVATLTVPATAAGPSLLELLVGSEGAFGVITEVTLRVRPRPAAPRYEGWFFRSFAEGVEALRRLAQEDATPDVARLSDEQETRVSMLLAGVDGARARIGDAYLRLRGYAGGCLAILGWAGDAADVGRRRARSVTIARRAGGLALGTAVGEGWRRGRFSAPYLRDDMLDRGVMVETLETAATWANLARLYDAVRGALHSSLAARGTEAIVLCHVSHLYPDGASLYFTWIARQEQGREIEQWRAAKSAASDAIVAAGGTITHHHAIGRDHAPWLGAEDGPLGIDALRAVKERLDPAGIMNPGKLLPAP